MSLTKPVAVIVGVGPGLGKSLAKRFANGGYAVGLVARREDNLTSIQKELEESGHTAISATADASNAASLIGAFEKIRQKFGTDPEVLVYNASGFQYGGIMEIKPEALQNAFNLAAVGALVASQQVLPGMSKNGKGTILLTGATASLRGSANFGLFAVSKFAVRALAQSMAREYSPKGVHVAHIVIDGQINTPEQTKNKSPSEMEAFLNSDAIAETYWQLHIQPRTTWTHELDLRPSVEQF